MFNRINESFERNYQPLEEAKMSDAEMLRKLLTATANSMLRTGNNNLKAFEIAFQEDIESFFPGMCWWEVTTCNIFMELFNTRDPLAVVDCIIENLTDEFKDGGLNDTPGDAVDQANTDAKGIVGESKSLNEEPEVTFDDKDLFDPKSISLKGMAQKAVEKERAEIAEKERQERIAAYKEQYKDVLDGITDMSTDDAIDRLFNALVPGQGKADTVAGELVRAITRILYRDWNDGDKFFAGYGLETCASEAQYLSDMGFNDTIESILSDADRLCDNDGDYTSAINKLADEVVAHIVANPDLLGEPNTTDSRRQDYERIEERQPKFDYDFTIPYEVYKYIDADHISYREIEDILESNLDGNYISYDSIECSGDYVYIFGLTYDGYSEVEHWRMWKDSYWETEISEWESEYGDPDEDEEDDDLDESKKLKESPVYDMSPQYDARQSFYGKARVDDNGKEKTLYSYNTPVAKIADGKVTLLPKWDWSQTTLRHVKEFLKQNGFEANSLSQMRNTYL